MLMIFSSLTQINNDGSELLRGVQSPNPNFIQRPIITNDNVNVMYPICRQSWKGLTVLDFLIISELAYSNGTAPNDLLERTFYGTSMNNPKITYYSNYSDTRKIRFLEVFWAQTNLTVISIRGTSNLPEVIINVMLYYGISMSQIFEAFVPYISKSMQAIQDKIIFGGMLGKTYSNAYDHIVKHIKKNKTRYPGPIILTGHSLGGALAGLAAIKTNVTAIVFGAPGIGSFLTFNNKVEKFRKNIQNVITYPDFVPKIGRQQNMDIITCVKDTSILCHSVQPTICSLLRLCGDFRGRNFSSLCSKI